jgi:hypothetical protein
MPRGNVYYGRVFVSFTKGKAKARNLVNFETSFVGYDHEDALKRLQEDPEKIAKRNKKKLGKINDVKVDKIEIIHESGKTLYDIDTGKTFSHHETKI